MRRLLTLIIYLIFSMMIFSIDFQKYEKEMKSMFEHSNNKFIKKYSKKELTMDLKLIERLLIEIHPEADLYMEDGELEKLFDLTYKKLENEMNYFTFYNILNIVLDKTGDGNIEIKHSETVESIYKKSFKLPFKIELVGNMVCFASKGYEVPYGAQILSINNMDIDRILNELSIFTFTDGESIAHKYRNLENREKFAEFYYNYYGEEKNFIIKYLFKNKIEEVKITAKISEEKKSEANETEKNKTEILYKGFNADTSYIALSGNISPEYAKEEFEILFRALQRNKAKNLIIDMRKYANGSKAVLDELLSYLIDKSGKFAYPERYVNQEIPYKEYVLNSEEETAKIENEMKNSQFRKNLNKFESLKGVNDFQFNKKLKYNGNLFILANSSFVNNSVRFLSLLEHYSDSVSSGEETKGGALRSTGEPGLVYELPNTHILLKIPYKEIELNINQIYSFGRGVIPDDIFIKTINEFFDEKDAQLEKILWDLEQERLLEIELERIRLEAEKAAEEEKMLNDENITKE